jgi:SinI restriction endonuclease
MSTIPKNDNAYFLNSLDQNTITHSGIKIVMPVWDSIVNDNSKEEKERFVERFIKGYKNRPSNREGKPTNTIPDPIIDLIIQERMPEYSVKDIDLIRFGHRLSMAAENILGLILEEFIHDIVIKHGWSCCWGNSISAVDFCSENGSLLQVKNRSNTENSSSNRIRSGTEIKKWYRVNASTGNYYWDELNNIIGKRNLLSEDKFISFCKKLITNNPSVLYVNET